MAFAQLTYRESLRDIECCLRAMRGKLYHMGIRGKVSRITIAYTNENRDWRIYCDFAQILIHQARQLYSACTGWDTSAEKMMALGERIFTIFKAFTIREGLNRKDETLPTRFFEEQLPEGPAKGTVLS